MVKMWDFEQCTGKGSSLHTFCHLTLHKIESNTHQ